MFLASFIINFVAKLAIIDKIANINTFYTIFYRTKINNNNKKKEQLRDKF